MRLSRRYFDVYLARVKNGGLGRVYIVVSTKVSKKSVERNLVRRRLREIIRLTGVDNCLNVKIFVAPSALKASFGELRGDFAGVMAEFKNEVAD